MRITNFIFAGMLFLLFYNINIVHISKGTLIITNLFATLSGSTV